MSCIDLHRPLPCTALGRSDLQVKLQEIASPTVFVALHLFAARGLRYSAHNKGFVTSFMSQSFLNPSRKAKIYFFSFGMCGVGIVTDFFRMPELVAEANQSMGRAGDSPLQAFDTPVS